MKLENKFGPGENASDELGTEAGLALSRSHVLCAPYIFRTVLSPSRRVPGGEGD